MHMVPGGFRSYYGEELKKRRLLEHRLRSYFTSLGFEEIESPSLELSDVFESVYSRDRIFFVEDLLEGERLALRYDHTLPVVRNFLTRFARDSVSNFEQSGTFYIGKVFRNIGFGRGSLREFTQAGVEIFGLSEPEGERQLFRVLSGVVDILKELGGKTDGLVLVVGYAPFWKSLIGYISDKVSVPEDFVRSALEKRDLHLFPKEVFSLLSRVYDFKSDFDMVEKEIENAGSIELEDAYIRLKEFRERLLEEFDFKVVFDPGMAVNTRFYSGLVFSLNHSSLSFPIANGGRYDPFSESLYSKMYGRREKIPSAGFALGLERLVALL